ncbi:relaxase/mobilization nuclease domain-containing protein [Variovorax sp. RB3P1]|uniref:relaxase/mobilization nuclease domain-containing protein n=1 Tax=Variovorax sp. RB3P1 TaxID=3443732 RepID=UPI003F456902
MLIKISNYRRKKPRRPSDLRRLIRYLFEPKPSVNIRDHRLLGPPELHHLLLTARPWGSEIGESADDLTHQFIQYCREASSPGPVPEVWYVHLIFSFSPASTPTLRSPTDCHRSPASGVSHSANAIRVATDALDFLGWSGTQPSLFVVHGDRKHVHVHAVIAIPVYGGTTWDVLRFSRRQLHEIAKLAAEAFDLPTRTRNASSRGKANKAQ